ncbi:MAG: hypothetical protein AVDCRST_MAG77-5303, partial [uncultured Chloroflexi bacterium]
WPHSRNPGGARLRGRPAPRGPPPAASWRSSESPTPRWGTWELRTSYRPCSAASGSRSLPTPPQCC